MSTRTGTEIKVRDLEVGMTVLSVDDTWQEVTYIAPFGTGQRLIALDGQVDGVYRVGTVVKVKERVPQNHGKV